MFARITASLVLLSMMAPAVQASSTSTFDESTLKNYFVFDEGTWWDYVKSIDSVDSSATPDNVTIVDNTEDATYRKTAGSCKYANCTTYSSDADSITFGIVAEDGQSFIRQINGQDVDKIVTLDVNGISGDVSDLLELMFGITLSSSVTTSLSCEFTDDGKMTIGGYTAGVIENVCTMTFDYDDATFGSMPTMRVVSREVYMENIGEIYTESKYYQDSEWQYTTYENLSDTSIGLIDLSEDTSTTSTTTSTNTGSDETTTTSTENTSTTAENPFSDLSEKHRNYDAILYLYDQGMINGYDDGSFKPNNTLNRAELLKILVEGKGETPDVSTYHDCFTDVSTDWYAPSVCYAKEQGWVSGYPDGSFKPADTVNKVEALKMLLNSQGVETVTPTDAPYSDVSVSDWFAPYVEKAKALGILEETDATFLPDGDRTRGSICENLYRLLTQQ